jgi:hypothetical protein
LATQYFLVSVFLHQSEYLSAATQNIGHQYVLWRIPFWSKYFYQSLYFCLGPSIVWGHFKISVTNVFSSSFLVGPNILPAYGGWAEQCYRVHQSSYKGLAKQCYMMHQPPYRWLADQCYTMDQSSYRQLADQCCTGQP